MSTSHYSYAPLTPPMDEATHHYDAPEVDRAELDRGLSPQLARSASFDSPEFCHAPTQASSKPEGERYHSYAESPFPGHSSVTSGPTDAAFAIYQDAGEKQPEKQRYFGMRKAVFIIVLIIIISLVVAGIVLGVVFGVVLPNQNKSSKPSKSSPNSSPNSTPKTSPDFLVASRAGLATATAADDKTKTYVYFQDPDGSIFEGSYQNEKWSIKADGTIDAGFVTKAAIGESPLAAVSYNFDGHTFRQIFFYSPRGEVITMNRTEAESWGSPMAIPDTSYYVGGIGLAACASAGFDYGLRVYYPGAAHDSIIEIKKSISDTFGWVHGQNFSGSDPLGGVGCAMHEKTQTVNVYMRNALTNVVQQFYTDYESGWGTDGTQSPADGVNHTDIVVCDDETDTEYVFYQLENGTIARGTISNLGIDFDPPGFISVPGTQGALKNTKMAASFAARGSFLMYQASSNHSLVFTTDIDRNGNLLFEGEMGV